MKKEQQQDYPSQLRLVQLQIIHRHGPRTPLNYRLPQFYSFAWPICSVSNPLHSHTGVKLVTSGDESLLSASPDADGRSPPLPTKAQYSPGDCVLGQLTNVGRSVMEQLGASLRHRYMEQLGFKCDGGDEEIYLRSTNFARTIESLQSLLKGLFPNRTPIDPPFKVHIRDEYLEDMYGSTKCQGYNQLLQAFEKRFSKETAEEVSELKKRLSHIFEVPDLYGRLPSTYGVYDTLVARRAHGLSLPRGVTDQVMDQLANLSYREWFQIFTESQMAIKFAVGRFIRELNSNLFREDRRLCIYSAHDSTIAPIMAALSPIATVDESTKDELLHYPPFASNIIMEVHEEKEKSNRFVRVVYNGKALILPQCQALGDHYQDNPSFCTLKAFSLAMKKFIPKNYLEECKTSD